jgi:hypothetical protein
MAVIGAVSSYDMIQAHRARLRDFAQLNEQRSAARQEAAQRTLSHGEYMLSGMANATSNANVGTSQLTSMIIRSRMAAEAKAKAEPSKWYV